MRDGLAVRAERGGVGARDHRRPAARPRARRAAHQHRRDGWPRRRRRPRRQPGHDGRDRRRARHLDRRDRRARADRDARRHRLARALALAADLRRRARRRPDDARDPGLRPGLEPRLQPRRGPARDLGGARGASAQRLPARARVLRASRARRGRAARRRRRAQDPRGRRRRARAAALRARPRRCPRRAARRPHRRHERAALRRGHDRRHRGPHLARLPRRGLRRRALARHARARRARAHPDLLDDADRALRRSTRPRSTSRWCRPCTCSCRARARRLDDRAPSRPRRDDGRRGPAARPRRDRDALERLAGHGPRRRGRAPRVPERRRDAALRGAGPGPADNERVLRHLAKVTINPAIAHGLAGHVGSLEPGKLADVVLWQPHHFGVRPELVLKAGIAVHGASGEGNASTSLAEPVLLRRQVGGAGGRRRCSRSRSWPARRSPPTSRPRARASRSKAVAS